MKNKGFIALSTVLIISAVTLSIVITVAHLSIGEGQSGLAIQLSEENLADVEGCVEEILLKIHGNASYSATSLAQSPTGTCSFTYNTTNPWDVDVSYTYTDTASPLRNFNRKIKVKFSRSPTAITLISWQEI